jgi:hypothetical protein
MLGERGKADVVVAAQRKEQRRPRRQQREGHETAHGRGGSAAGHRITADTYPQTRPGSKAHGLPGTGTPQQAGKPPKKEGRPGTDGPRRLQW